MTLLDRILAHGPELPGDPIIAARIERHLRRVQPDPLFRKRLRSVVVNRYVATREGLAVPVSVGRPRRQMGLLGRGILYASLLTAASVTAVGAASQGSLPGDALYGVKLGIEQFRMHVAPPGLRDDLAAMALDERLDEVEQLAGTGRWGLVPEAAARAAAAEVALEAAAPGEAALLLTGENSMARHAQRLAELMTTAPASALVGLQRALAASGASHPSDANAGNGGGAGSAGGSGQDTGSAAAPGGLPHDPRASAPRDGNGTPATGGSTDGNGANGDTGSGKNDGEGHAPPPSPSAGPGGDGPGSGDGGDGQGDNGSGGAQ
jgi:hypothetical protein